MKLDRCTWIQHGTMPVTASVRHCKAHSYGQEAKRPNVPTHQNTIGNIAKDHNLHNTMAFSSIFPAVCQAQIRRCLIIQTALLEYLPGLVIRKDPGSKEWSWINMSHETS